jgi:tetratricopeptide (TPR) repeat protein/predicted Ser/Thr protein kinase
MECPDEPMLVDFARGKLASDRREAVEAHATDCVGCAAILSGLAETRADASRRSDAGPALDEPVVGAHIARFRVERLVGAGGMGVVYRALDPELDRPVALKLLRPELLSPVARARLLREAQAMARLSHPNVVVVYEVGGFRDQTFLAMEYVEGQTLRDWLRQEKRSVAAVVELFLQAGRGLAAAHAAGIVHRDFKPGNVLVGDDGRARVTDFGLARGAGQGDPAPDSLSGFTPHSPFHDDMTQPGTLIGTPAYMPPEQRRHERASEKSDQWSFCASLHEALHGVLPGVAPTQKDVPAAIQKVILRGLREDPDDRWPSMEALLDALGRDPTRRRLRIALAAGGLAVVALAIAVPLAFRSQRCGDDKLAETWGPRQRDGIRAAFAATKVPAAAELAGQSVAALDAYAADLTKLRDAACRARGALSERASDLRMACLDQRRRDLGAVAGVLSRADEKTVLYATDVGAALAAPATCDDVATLTTIPAPAPAIRERVAEAQTSRTIAIALGKAGRHGEAIGRLNDVVGEARRLGYAPLEATALLSLGSVQGSISDFSAARQAFLAGVAAADEARDDATKGALWLGLAFQLGVGQGQFEEAHQDIRYAEAALRRAENAGMDVAVKRLNLDQIEALVLYKELRYSEADVSMQRAMRALDRANLADLDTATLLMNYGVMLKSGGRLAEAEIQYRRALDLYSRGTTEAHPMVAAVWNNLADARADAGDLEGALAAARTSAGLREKYLPESLNLGLSYVNLGEILRRMGKLDDALGYIRRAADLFTRKQGPDGPYLGYALTSLGQILYDQGKPREATEALEHALRIRQTGKTPPPLLAETRLALGMALWDATRDPRGRALVAEARDGLAGKDLATADAWLARHAGGSSP